MKEFVSVVVPVFNEEDCVFAIFERVKMTMVKKGIAFELIFVDDGSTDASWEKIQNLSEKDKRIKGFRLSRNVGQHNAIFAGFENASGKYVLTIDADMQGEPNILPALCDKLNAGYDIVGCKRKNRRDTFFRKFISYMMHFSLRHFTKMGEIARNGFSDYGCMLRGYRRWVIDEIIRSGGKSIYLPTFSTLIGGKFCELEIEYRARKKGRTGYGIRKLTGLYFDMIADISLFPVRFISLLGVLFSVAGFFLGFVILFRRIFIGPEVEGVFTLFAFLFILAGVLLVSVGIIGEYVGRIHREVSKRPRFVVKENTGSPRQLRMGVFAYSEVGYMCLKKLIDMGENILFVITHKDSKDENIWFNSVSNLAERHGIPVLKPNSVNESKFIELISSVKPNILLCFYYRQVFGKRLLSIPLFGCINMHGSLLPKYRGCAPVNWAIINGEKETGVTLHYMHEKADVGPIIIQRKIKIEENDTGLSLTKKVASVGAVMVDEIVNWLKEGNISSTPQDESIASYYGKRTPDMGKISWYWSNSKIGNYVRALKYPFPGAFFYLDEKKCIISGGNSTSADKTGEPGMIMVSNEKSTAVQTGKGWFNISGFEVDGEQISPRRFIEKFRLKEGDILGS